MDSAFAPIAVRVRGAKSLPAWTSLATPDDFSLSAQPYMTAVGEHLLLLPQCLEPFAASGALQLPDSDASTIDESESVYGWLEALGGRAVEALLAMASNLATLSPGGVKQLGADCAYLRMVLSNGLGLASDPRLEEMDAALTAPSGAASGLAQLTTTAEHVPKAVAHALMAAVRAGADSSAARGSHGSGARGGDSGATFQGTAGAASADAFEI